MPAYFIACAQVHDWYASQAYAQRSPEYKPLIALRQGNATFEFILTESGLPKHRDRQASQTGRSVGAIRPASQGENP